MKQSSERGIRVNLSNYSYNFLFKTFISMIIREIILFYYLIYRTLQCIHQYLHVGFSEIKNQIKG